MVDYSDTQYLNEIDGKKVYFASDSHFGLDLVEDPIISQKRFCRWLDSIQSDCKALFLVGDIFDYWFEYGSVVPKGYIRVLARLAEFTDAGIPVYMFYGNHDIWMFDYLPKEIGVQIIPNSWEGNLLGKKFFIAHGDGLGDPSKSFRVLRGIFRSKFLQALYRWIHPDITVPFGFAWAHYNRKRKVDSPANNFLGEDKEFQIIWSKKYLQSHPDTDFFIYGHRHIQLDYPISDFSRVIILGEWITMFTYAVFDGESLVLKNFEKD